MFNIICFPILFILAFVLGGIIIILRKKEFDDKLSAVTTTSATNATISSTVDSIDPSAYYYSPWGWIQKKEVGNVNPVLATDCHFNSDSTVDCHFPGNTDLITLKLSSNSTGKTTVVSGTSGSVKLTRTEYSAYSYVSQGAITPKCAYYFVPAQDATVLNVPRKSQIISAIPPLKELPYTPECVLPNVVSGQHFIRACVGTFLFGSAYSSVPRCLDSTGSVRNVNDVENYVSKCGVDPCKSDIQLSVLRFQPDPGATTSPANKVVYVEAPVNLGSVGHETENPQVVIDQPLTLVPETVNGAPQQLFEVDRYNSKGAPAVTGTYFRIRHQSHTNWNLIVDHDPPTTGPLVMKFAKIGGTTGIQNNISWLQLNATTSTNNAVFTYDNSTSIPISEKMDITRFKNRIESFHTSLLALVGPENDSNKAIYNLVSMYTGLVTDHKIYVTVEGKVQGVVDIIEVIQKAANVVQGNSIGNLGFEFTYSAFDYLYELYYSATSLTSIPQINQRTQFLSYIKSNFDHVFSAPMADEDNVKYIINNVVSNSLIPRVDDMLTIVPNNFLLLLLKATLVEIQQVSTTGTGLDYLKNCVKSIPNYSSTSVDTFVDNWVLVRNVLVDNAMRIFNDRELYNNFPNQFVDYKNSILSLINQVQGHLEILSFINGGLVYTEKALYIPLASSEIFNWFVTNQGVNPVYRVYREDALTYGIEQVTIQDLTYFGTINTATSSTLYKSSLEMKNILGINSGTDIEIL